MKTPIALFTYNRPHHLRQLFDSLLRCARLDECQVYIFCDGAKKPEHELGVQAARQLVDEFASKLNATVVKHKQNVGLAHSVVSGVTELCEQYGRVIVLEDDFILHPFFIDFMLQSLDCYAEEDKVAQVAGYLPLIYPNIETDSFFLPLTTSCGWATWQRAWKLFSWDTEPILQILDVDLQMRTHFDLDNAYPYSDMLRSVAEGKVDSWAIHWYCNTFYNKKLTLYPYHSLVWVGGFDNLATHTKSEEIPAFYDQSLDFVLQGNWNSPISFPGSIQVDEISFNKLKKFLRRETSRSFLARSKATLKRALMQLVK